MSEQEFDEKMNNYELDQEYSEFIYEKAHVCNNDQLIFLMERGDYLESFKETMVTI